MSACFCVCNNMTMTYSASAELMKLVMDVTSLKLKKRSILGQATTNLPYLYSDKLSAVHTLYILRNVAFYSKKSGVICVKSITMLYTNFIKTL